MSALALEGDLMPVRAIADRQYSRKRAKAIAYGQWNYSVDAEPIRVHVKALRARPMTLQQIADSAGIHLSTVHYVLFGRNGKPPKKTWHDTAEKLRAVRVEALGPAPAIAVRPGGSVTDPTGTSRRLRALVAIGYRQNVLAGHLGLCPSGVGRLIKLTDPVRVARAREVTELYDRLSRTPGPSEQARVWAARRGWEPPIAWDDDTIDDPDAHPAGTFTAELARIMRGDLEVPLHDDATGVSGNPPLRAVTVEAIRRLAAEGLIDREISERLGGRLSRTAVTHARQRHGIPSGSATRSAAVSA